MGRLGQLTLVKVTDSRHRHNSHKRGSLLTHALIRNRFAQLGSMRRLVQEKPL